MVTGVNDVPSGRHIDGPTDRHIDKYEMSNIRCSISHLQCWLNLHLSTGKLVGLPYSPIKHLDYLAGMQAIQNVANTLQTDFIPARYLSVTRKGYRWPEWFWFPTDSILMNHVKNGTDIFLPSLTDEKIYSNDAFVCALHGWIFFFFSIWPALKSISFPPMNLPCWARRKRKLLQGRSDREVLGRDWERL